MSPRMTFEEYKKSSLLASEPIYDPCDPNLRGFIRFKPAKVLKNSVRILIKSIVNDLLRYHNLGRCMKAINSTTIIIVNGVAFLDGASTKYTDDGAKKNCLDVAAFIEVEILNGRKDIPYSLTHFLELIRDDLRNNVDFIKYHYGILPNHLRGTFISNCVLAGGGLKGTLGDQAHDTTRVMSNLSSFHDWPRHLPGSGCLRTKCKPAKGEENSPYGLLDFHRFIVDHLGELIPMFDKDASSYFNWHKYQINSIGRKSVKVLLKRCYTPTIKEPEMKLGKALSVLESLFPEFMTSFQVTLHSKNMLKDLGMNPSCDS